MLGTIRKHQKWLWLFIATATIISFLAWTDPSGRLGFSFGGGSRNFYISPVNGKEVRLYGTPISNDEFYKAYQETRIKYFIGSGGKQWPGTDESTARNLERETLSRVLLMRKLKDLDIYVSPKAVGRMARERIGDVPYDRFVREFLEVPGGASSADFERFCEHEAGIQQLASVAAIESEIVNPREIEALYRKDHEEVTTELAVFWATNFMDKVTVTPEAVAQYYASNQFSLYRIPPRIQLSYVEFPATNYLAEADKEMAKQTNLNAIIEEYYFKQGTNSFKDTNGVVLSETAAKAKIKEDFREQLGVREARRKASDFGNELSGQPNRLDLFEKLAAAKGYPVKTSPPIGNAGDLENTDLPLTFYRDGLALTNAAPIRYQPIVGDKAVYLIALRTNLPSELPPLDKIRDKVTLDFKHERALALARAAGTNFYHLLTNGLAQKKTFIELCAENKVKTMPVPPFSASTRSLTNLDERINLQMLQSYAFTLKPGEVSPFLPDMKEGGEILYLRGRLPFDEAKVKADLPEFIAMYRNARLNDAFNSWFRKQAEQAQLVVPQKETSPQRPRS